MGFDEVKLMSKEGRRSNTGRCKNVKIFLHSERSICLKNFLKKGIHLASFFLFQTLSEILCFIGEPLRYKFSQYSCKKNKKTIFIFNIN